MAECSPYVEETFTVNKTRKLLSGKSVMLALFVGAFEVGLKRFQWSWPWLRVLKSEESEAFTFIFHTDISADQNEN